MAQAKALYIGAGEDVLQPIETLPEIRHFVFVDSLPATQQPGFIYAHTQRDPLFKNVVKLRLASIGFREVETEYLSSDAIDWTHPHVVRYQNKETGKTVLYYMSYGFPQDLEFDLATHFHSATHVILCGHHPHQVLLDFLPKKITWVCYPGTCYGKEECEDESIVRALYDRKDLDIVLIPHRFWRRHFCCFADLHASLTKRCGWFGMH